MKNIKKIHWVIILIGFLLIPSLFGVLFFLLTPTPVPCGAAIIWFLTCVVGTNVFLSVATGGIVWAIAVIIWLVKKIKGK